MQLHEMRYRFATMNNMHSYRPEYQRYEFVAPNDGSNYCFHMVPLVLQPDASHILRKQSGDVADPGCDP